VQLTPEIVTEANLEQDTGVMIFQVEPETPAKRAGLTMGDVVIRFNNQPVATFYDLPRLLTEDTIDKKTKITILRGEKVHELIITPAAAEGQSDD
jgi:S1-C subfamily serine protease